VTVGADAMKIHDPRPAFDPAAGADDAVDVTFLMPCLNEAMTLPSTIQGAQEAAEALASQGLRCEILISDNGSDDGSVELATSLGCRVVHCEARGYGSALIHGCESARGNYIVMADSDDSYDFREGVAMVERLREGYELCMGSRFKGKILPGAMPWKNRYLGNPALTGILNLLYRSGLSDAHCGLRSLTKEAFKSLRLESRGMEFASEMVVKATLLNLRRTEVPVTLRPDGRGRPPHLRPWRDGWRHLKFLLTLSPLGLYFVPAALLIGFSTAIFSLLLRTPAGQVYRWGPLWIGDHWLILSVGFFAIGYQAFLMGLAALSYTVERGYRRRTAFMRRIYRWTTVESFLVAGLTFGLAGLAVLASVFLAWSDRHYGALERTREVAFATVLIVAAFQNLFGGFLIAMLRTSESQ